MVLGVGKSWATALDELRDQQQLLEPLWKNDQAIHISSAWLYLSRNNFNPNCQLMFYWNSLTPEKQEKNSLNRKKKKS